MKNLLMKALFAGLVALSVVPRVHAATSVALDQEKRFAIPGGANSSGPDVEAKWALPSLSRRDFTVTALNPQDGELLIRSVCVTSTNTAGGYAALYDADSIANIVVGSNAGGSFIVAVAAKILASGGADTAKESCSHFPRGLPASTGLAWLTSHADIRATVIYDVLRK